MAFWWKMAVVAQQLELDLELELELGLGLGLPCQMQSVRHS
jgi:hypothetical protein